jgi:large subunit ribosomal protein L15
MRDEDELSPAPGSNKAKKRVGRGIGGKGGKTAGRRYQGPEGVVAARSPAASKVARCRLKQRVPKLKGFNNPFRVEYQPVNLDQIAGTGEASVTPRCSSPRAWSARAPS